MGLEITEGYHLEIEPMLFGNFRIIETDGHTNINNSWSYSSLPAAVAALANREDGKEPTGWHRHPNSGRRRPDGDESKEYIQW